MKQKPRRIMRKWGTYQVISMDASHMFSIMCKINGDRAEGEGEENYVLSGSMY